MFHTKKSGLAQQSKTIHSVAVSVVTEPPWCGQLWAWRRPLSITYHSHCNLSAPVCYFPSYFFSHDTNTEPLSRMRLHNLGYFSPIVRSDSTSPNVHTIWMWCSIQLEVERLTAWDKGGREEETQGLTQAERKLSTAKYLEVCGDSKVSRWEMFLRSVGHD